MISVVYACNDAYIRQTIISMVSVKKYNRDLKLYLIQDHMSEEGIKQIVTIMARYDQGVELLDLTDIIPDIRCDTDRHPLTVYAKLFMAEHMSDRRALYLDSDTVVTGSLAELWERDMSHESVAGVLMPYSKNIKKRDSAQVGNPYICDGVVLFNLERWRQKQTSNKCIEYIESYQGKPPMLSEGTLNSVCVGEIGVLDERYNLMPSVLEYSLPQIKNLFQSDYYYKDEKQYNNARSNPIVIHFMDELYGRPWRKNCVHPMRQEYLCIEQEIYGEKASDSDNMKTNRNRTLWFKRHMPFVVFSAIYRLKNII